MYYAYKEPVDCLSGRGEQLVVKSASVREVSGFKQSIRTVKPGPRPPKSCVSRSFFFRFFKEKTFHKKEKGKNKHVTGELNWQAMSQCVYANTCLVMSIMALNICCLL